MQNFISNTEMAENEHYLTIKWWNAYVYPLHIYQQFSVDFHLPMFASQVECLSYKHVME